MDDEPRPTAGKVILAQMRGRLVLRNTHQEVHQRLSPMTRLATVVTDKVGSMGFFLTMLGWTIAWLGWNTLAPARWRFDPPTGFVLYLFLCNVIQLLLMPLIMVGQNVHGMRIEARAEHDLEVNLKAAEEIETILHYMEQRNEILMRMVAKLDIDVRESLEQPSAVR